MIKPQSRLELIESLIPLVLPMIRDRAKISYPLPGNNENSVICIRHEGSKAYITPELYEILRIEVLQYTQNYLNSNFGFFKNENIQEIIKDRLELAFKDA